ncbi:MULTISPECIES: hypothetical protein [unclassified Tatumella]|uniref:hypothetical protein n=1 Tax=unclassified Tatumella TaxID=2649542 RepID=UPI001BAEC5FE|nr:MULTISPECIES: hypothetical protein [unclassified Tatumella]MBS0854966.1 hypothetical protein [Tatumella sp. JGM16]MBS0912072.1 hypothetical protein [Tatumella sp. JGM91]
MRNGQDEKFRVFTSSSEISMAKLRQACLTVSNEMNEKLMSAPNARQLFNPIKVLPISWVEDQPSPESNIWVSVNSTMEAAEIARSKLELMGYKTGNVLH